MPDMARPRGATDAASGGDAGVGAARRFWSLLRTRRARACANESRQAATRGGGSGGGSASAGGQRLSRARKTADAGGTITTAWARASGSSEAFSKTFPRATGSSARSLLADCTTRQMPQVASGENVAAKARATDSVSRLCAHIRVHAAIWTMSQCMPVAITQPQSSTITRRRRRREFSGKPAGLTGRSQRRAGECRREGITRRL